jgi:hypothetical protein
MNKRIRRRGTAILLAATFTLFAGCSLFQKKPEEPGPMPWPTRGQVPHTALRPRPEPADKLNWFEKMIGMEEEPAPPETTNEWMGLGRPGMGGSMR